MGSSSADETLSSLAMRPAEDDYVFGLQLVETGAFSSAKYKGMPNLLRYHFHSISFFTSSPLDSGLRTWIPRPITTTWVMNQRLRADRSVSVPQYAA